MKYSNKSSTDRIGVQTVGLEFEKHGYIFREQPISDCGIDAQIELATENEIASGKLIALQIKSGVSWFKESNEKGYVYRGDREHLEYWLSHSLPVLIVLCNTKTSVVFWQSISTDTIEYTPKGWKITVPFEQQVNAGMHTDLRELVEIVEIVPNYTITNISDSSHGTAKRYSARITLTKQHSQAELLLIIRKLTAEIMNCEYHRSEHTRIHWRNKPAHVVWLFIFPSPNDEKNNNFLCSTELISDDLSLESRPISGGGQEIGSGIRVNWNKDYLFTSRYNEENTLSKELFVQTVEVLSKKSLAIYNSLLEKVAMYQKSELNFSDLCMFIESDAHKAHAVYQDGTSFGLSSYECKDASNKFQSLIAFLDNLFLFLGDRDEHSQMFYIKNQAKYFAEAFRGLEFELQKIR